MISGYFTEDRVTYSTIGIVLYVFDDSKTTSFVKECLIPFRRAYISDEKLDRIEAKKKSPRKDIINRRLPAPGDVMSGDFGEILTYYMATEIWSPDVDYKPMKWQFKDDPKKASPKTDVVLFQLANDVSHPDTNDKLITYEAKAHATPITGTYKKHKQKQAVTLKDGRDCCTLLDAVFDADKDRASRAAESIIYLKNKAEDNEDDEFLDVLNRFDKGFSVPYKAEYNAVAIVESNDIDNQIARMPKRLMATFPDIRLYCMPIKNMKQVYEDIYSQLENT